MPSQETYLDLYTPLTFAERMGVRNQEIRRTFFSMLVTGLRGSGTCRSVSSVNRQMESNGTMAEDKKCLLMLCPPDDTMRT
ncbi:UNVERIFIED_CONTAM: hypothetical protein ABIC26_000155 [Paenibacillus sp. PvR008]